MTREDGQTYLLRLAALASLVLALVNHLLPPKPFAQTQLLFDYEFGLTRRGLVGEVLTWIAGPEISASNIHMAAAIVTLAGIGAFYLMLERLTRAGGVAPWLLLILALNSFAFASFAGNSGYLDGVLVALTILSFALPVHLAGIAMRVVIAVLGVLVHENMLPYFTLLMGADIWLRLGRDRAALLPALAPVAAGLLTLGMLATLTGFTATEAAEFAAHLEAKAGFWLDPTSTDVAGRSIRDNFALMAELRGQTKYWAWVLFDGVPLFLMALWLCWLALRLLGEEATPFAALVLVAAIFAPLSLNLIAFDVVRFGVASCIAGFALVALIMQRVEGAPGRLAELLTWPHFLLVLVLNANIFTIQVNIGAFHVGQFPWVLLTQLKWLTN